MSQREFIQRACDKIMLQMVAAYAIVVDQWRVLTHDGRIGTISQALRVGVGDKEGGSIEVAGFKFCLQRIVVPVSCKLRVADGAPLRPQAAILHYSSAWIRIVDLEGLLHVCRLVSDISNVERQLASELMLYRSVPLLNVGVLHIESHGSNAWRRTGPRNIAKGAGGPCGVRRNHRLPL